MAKIRIYEYVILIAVFVVAKNDAARILAAYPTPSFSHQVAFRPLTLELLKRGHEVVVITPDPMFRKAEAPVNLTEIDLHDLSYDLWQRKFLGLNIIQGNKSDLEKQILAMAFVCYELWEQQILQKEVQNLTNGKLKFDLLIHEAFAYPYLGFSYILKVPVIQISSLGSVADVLNTVGAPSHPIYPYNNQQKLYNMSLWEKLSHLYNCFRFKMYQNLFESYLDDVLKRLFGSDIPKLADLKNNVDLVFLNVYAFWELNRPAPPNLLYLGGLHQQPEKELPNDLKAYLDSSKNGVIYVSFGTNVDPAKLPLQKIQILINVLSKLPYDVLWKWSRDEMPSRGKNIKIYKWFPQADLLRHPKIKMFIMQGGLQSTDEAISAGVPLIGIPMLGDQWYNVEHCVHHGIGVRVDMETIDEEKFGNAVNEILNNESYRRNMLRLRDLVRDQPQTSLERAVWWTEYVIRHGGARHLRSPAANISWAQYLELELVFYLLTACLTVIIIFTIIIYKIMSMITKRTKLKIN